MAEGYCVKERKKVEIKDAKQVTMKNGRPAIQGVCPDCGREGGCTRGGADSPATGAPGATARSRPVPAAASGGLCIRPTEAHCCSSWRPREALGLLGHDGQLVEDKRMCLLGGRLRARLPSRRGATSP